ncbi:biotin-dependent carboxyltransferase family protein [Caballeronia sp. INDeC2]|uniref:5-oxoprolinase subunit C family protein n=1 Tax=Caballeronia sp. INDeC2 TaxID=2921747 RepID=UPI002028B69A|nr:biotin-dependent carboxyltransferase family protein [Caballeronia sp. INDeC2]
MIEVLSNAALATVQDEGRQGYLRYGVGTSGAMDRIALAVGNLLLGNDDNAAGIEIPLFPFRVRFTADVAFALTGADCAARLNDRPVLPWWTLQAREGDVLALGVPTAGARCYLLLEGGVDVPVVLGSRSTQLRGEFGGHNGRALQRGDVLRAAQSAPAATQADYVGFGVTAPARTLLQGNATPAAGPNETVVRVLPAAEYDAYDDASIQAFWRESWKVTPQSDRYGFRLAGAALKSRQPLEMRSHGIVPGVIQVPPSGQPIIQLRDAQPTGGYPKIGTVIEADLWRCAQARIGSTIRFAKASYQEALDAEDELQWYLNKLRHLIGLHRSAPRLPT